jgi:hypothetical protein
MAPRKALPDSRDLPTKVKDFLRSEYKDPEKWEANMKLLRAAGLFFGSIFLVRNYEEAFSV